MSMVPRDHRHILMVGPDLAAHGGVASVCATYAEAGMFQRLGVEFVPSFVQGSTWLKLRVACKAMARVWLRCATRRAAVVHVHAATNASFWRKALFYLPARLHGVPYVLHLHSGDMPAFLARCSAWQQRVIVHLLRKAATVIVLSDEWAAWLRDFCPAARITVVPNPVVVPPAADDRRSNQPTLLFLGRLTPEKGFPELVEALAVARRQVPDLVLQAGGEGEIAQARDLAAQHGVADAVQLLGWVGGAAKQRLLSTCWLFVLPSHHEGLPVGILEGMAHSMPFVATPVGAVAGLAAASGGGLVVPVGQPAELAAALVKLLGDAQLRRAMGAQARRHTLAHYDAAVVEATLRAVYAALQQRG